MKTIEQKMCDAVILRHNFKQTNTEVINLSDGSVFVKLYDTYIFAQIDGKNFFSDGGYKTATTGSRLRALGANYSVNDKKNKCDLQTGSFMYNLYFRHLFRIK